MDAIVTFEEGLALARRQAKVFKLMGYTGLMLPKRSEHRIELLAAKPGSRTTMHLTFHPAGVEVETLPTGSLAKARAMAEA
jgi:hypothetical protein